jgi:transcription elongation factor GreA
MKNVLPITLRGKKKLETELKKLISEDRPAVIRDIESARANGDLSENADYDAAKERQAWIEARIQDIQNHLAGAEVIDTALLKSETVIFGANVKITDLEEEKEVNYQIVGPDEADVKAGRVSIVSPLARALVGKKKGDVVLVSAPGGEKEYEIVKIWFE